MRRPSLPCFRQTRLYEQSENPILIDLRCSQGLYLAVRDGENGYLIQVTSNGADEKTPLLGSKGMNISLETEEMMKEVADILIRELSNYRVFELDEVENRQKMDSRIWK